MSADFIVNSFEAYLDVIQSGLSKLDGRRYNQTVSGKALVAASLRWLPAASALPLTIRSHSTLRPPRLCVSNFTTGLLNAESQRTQRFSQNREAVL